MTKLTSIPIPPHKRKEIGLYCAKHISPQRYYIHDAIGGVGWRIALTGITVGWTVEAPEEHLLMIRLKYGV